ncbi:MAG: molecular chaperone [Azoarcus sp.]|nr:molecular chaperone [Azoarcus sp.]
MITRFQIRGLVAAVPLVVCGTVVAAGLQVSPTGLEFLPPSPAQGLRLTNTGSDALHAQVRVFHWTQANGKDVLTPTQALVASPPMLSLAPGAQQLVRVIRLDAANPSGAEDAYRLLVDELPPPEERKETGVRYVLRYSIPVFMAPTNPPDAAAIAGTLHWSLRKDDKGIFLQAQNTGAFHAQLSEVSLLPLGGVPVQVSAGLLGYVLPGMTMRWPLKLGTARFPTGTRLKFSINGKPIDQTFAVDDLPL